MDKWQDMETAPKDGSEFQTWSEQYGWVPRARIVNERIEEWDAEYSWQHYTAMDYLGWMPQPEKPEVR